MKLKKNDNVMVVAGNARGKSGKILKIFRENDRVIVEGVNIVKRHSRPSQKNPKGGIVQKEAPIHASKVMVICPKCNTASRLGRAVVTDSLSGKKQRMRICRNCNEMF